MQEQKRKNAKVAPDDEWLGAEMERLAEAVLLAIDPDAETARDESELLP
jgi:hypothetical protein